MSAIYAGIDPGLSGAIGFLDARGRFVGVIDMPTLPTTTGRRCIDAEALAVILRQYAPGFTLVERVGPRPGEGAVGAFSFGQSVGIIGGVLATLRLPHDVVQPATWKRRAGIPAGAAKGVSIATAKRLLPDGGDHLTRVKDDGRAEALLLAYQAWERRQ
jgi:crossover junction endodeoxyribonuclease RuvC